MGNLQELISRSSRQFLNRLDLRVNQSKLVNGSYVAIDWTDPSVSVQELIVRNGEVEVGRQFHDKWPEDVNPAKSPQLAGEWLRQRIAQSGIAASNAVVSVPRRSVSLRLLELPQVDDSELTEVVSLQVESRPELASDGHVFDFLPLPVSATAVNRYVLLASVLKTVLEQIDETLAAAGLSICASGVGELAVDSLTTVRVDGLTLNVLANYSKVEFVLSIAGVPVASHSMRMSEDNPDEIAQSIPNISARMIAALPEKLSSEMLSLINLSGPHGSTLEQAARESCNCTVRLINTPCNEAVRTLALLTSLSRDGHTLNFHSPRRPTDLKLARRRQLTRYAAGVAVLAGLLGYWVHDEKSQLENQLVTLQASSKEQQELNDRGQKTLDAWQFVSAWQSSSVNWADEMHAFAEQLPEPGKGYLTRIQLEQAAGADVPVIRADGLAKEPEVAMAFNRKLMSVKGKYELQPHGIEPATRDSAFRSSFRVEAAIRNALKETSPESSR
tara:strand:- start:12839 stop:14341 length:1503 start_codon:yes stop_codon:yes gene_type:complete